MGKWIKRIIKILVAAFFVFVVWRVTLGDDKTTLKAFMVTEPSAAAYAEDGELYVLSNEMADDISTPILRQTDEEAPEGQFIAYGFYYIPETKEFQITVRYNDTTEETLGDFNFFAYTVDTSGEPMEESEDGQRLHFGYPIGEVLSPTYNSDVKEKMFYNFEKLVFEGVDIDENTNVVVSLCYGDDNTAEVSNIVVHFAEQDMRQYKLTKKNISALESFTAEEGTK